MDRLPERIRSERLVPRLWKHDEASILGDAVAASIDHLRPWMPWAVSEPLTLAERVALIEGWTRDWEDGGDAIYGVFFDGTAIGGCGLHRRGAANELEIGYWIAASHTRRGYATELTHALTAAAFGVDGVERVVVVTDEANTASAGVPPIVGFTRERIEVRGPNAPAESGRMIIWSVTSGAWHQK